VGEAAVGPHPGDGLWCATLRNVSGPAGVQCMSRAVEVPAGAAAVVAWRYRTQASAQPRIYLDIDGRRSRIAHLPAAQDGWRPGRIDLAPAPATRAVRVVMTNYGRDPEDVLGLRDLGIWSGDR
jgi:hypothetical protein